MASDTIDTETKLTIGALTIDTEHEEVLVNGEKLQLPKKEYLVLECLARTQGQIVSRDMLMKYLYGSEDKPHHNIIRTFVCYLRQKLSEATGDENYIQTIVKRGYCLSSPKHQ